MREELRAIVEKNIEPMIDDIRSLVAIPSVLNEATVTPEHSFGPKVSEALARFLEIAQRMGFNTKNIDNMVGYAEMGDGPLFGILVHLDVVPGGKESLWKHGAPFDPTIEGGKLYGRGTIDDKGPAVASLYAVKALIDADTPLKYRFRVIAGLDEESGFRCMKRYQQTEEIPQASFSPDSIFPVVNAEKGILQFSLSKKISNLELAGLPELFDIRGGDALNVVPDELKMFFKNAAAGYLEYHLLPIGATVTNTGRGIIVKVPGHAAHASRPHEGENAIQKFLSVAAQLDFGPPELHLELVKLGALLSGTDGTGLGVACVDEVSGPLTCNFARISYADGTISAGCDIRYPVTGDGEAIAERIARAARGIGWSAEILHLDPPLYVEEKSALVKTLLAAYEEVTGEKAKPVSIGGGTYSRSMPNSVSFGATFPGDERTAHTANEYISLASLARMTHVYAEALARINDGVS